MSFLPRFFRGFFLLKRCLTKVTQDCIVETQKGGKKMALFMNLVTGSVAPLEEWKQDFAEIAPEEREHLWGGKDFEDGGLVEVVWNSETENYEEVL